MATYGGVDIFLRPFTTTHEPAPSAIQYNEYFGLSGKQSVWGGYRDRLITITGLLWAPTLYLLNVYEDVWTGPGVGLVGDGIARDLWDTRGRLWVGCLCEKFTPASQVRIDANFGYHFRYTSVFRGLL